jgi:branched-chain amino acid transport system substrate-binding protein
MRGAWVFLLSAAACARTTEAQSPAVDTVLIGSVISLTGAQATFGIQAKNGLELAVRRINDSGGVHGRKLALRIYDDQGRAEEAANAATRLISGDHASVIIGEASSSNSLAMAPKAQAARVPMISPSSTHPKVTEVGDYIFRVCFIDPFQGEVMATFAKKHLQLGSVATLRDQKSDYSMGLAAVFEARFVELGGRIVSREDYAQGDTDFRAQLTAIKSKRPEAIFIPGYYTDAGLIARQAKELGVQAILLGGDGWESDKLFELGGRAIEGAYYSNHYSADDPSPAVKGFRVEYARAFGGVPDSGAALNYDATMLAADAMRRASSFEGPALRDAIAQTRDFPGVAGTITLDAHRNAIKPAVVLQVRGGKTEFVVSIDPR